MTCNTTDLVGRSAGPGCFARLRPAHEISFGPGGNASDFELEGWAAAPSGGLTHAVGPASRLRLPAFDRTGDLLLILEGEPVARSPHGRQQRIRVLIDGKPIAKFVVDDAFLRCVRIKGTALRQGSILEFRHPDKIPSGPGEASGRQRLSVGWRRIRLFRVNHARSPSEVGQTPVVPPPEGSRSVGRQAVQVSSLTGATLGELLSSFTVTSSRSTVRSADQRNDYLVGIADDLPDDASLVRCSVAEDGALSFSFSRVWVAGSDPEPVRQLVLDRWRAVLPLFQAYGSTGRLAGSVIISLGDEAHARGLAFCARARDTLLIPDPYFLRGFGYEALRRSFAEVDPPEFDVRRPVALWRGSSTGYRGGGGLLDLHRVKLCRLGRERDNSALLDVGLTSLVQLQSEGEDRQLREMGLMAEFVAPDRLREWRFHIDVDGNTNSWPGLFQKLLSGSLVFKVTSADGWRQWYYDRLVPHVNFVPIASDLSDLVEKVTYYRHETAKAKEIAENGRSLAVAMTYVAELARAMRVVEDGIVRDGLGHA